MSSEFWVYDNKPTSSVTIHFGECRSCNHGKGAHNTTNTENGKWLGRYNALNLAEAAAKQTGRKNVSFCKLCARRKAIAKQ